MTNKIPLLYILLTSINYLKTHLKHSQTIRLLHSFQKRLLLAPECSTIYPSTYLNGDCFECSLAIYFALSA